MNPKLIGMQAAVPPRQKKKKKDYVNPLVWIFLSILGVAILGYAAFVFYSRSEGLGHNKRLEFSRRAAPILDSIELDIHNLRVDSLAKKFLRYKMKSSNA